MLFPLKEYHFTIKSVKNNSLTMTNNVLIDGLDQVGEFYAEAFRVLDPAGKVPPIDVQYYPYVGINHTIRLRSGRIFVRISEICRDMPPASHKGLAFILVAKLLRKKVPRQAEAAYTSYIRTPAVRERATENKRMYGRKVVTPPRGEVYDLDEIFDSLNERYFRGRLPKPVLSWSAKKTYRMLGHHDSTHETVVISRSLDDISVPRHVVEYVLFHEMLHVAHPTVHHNGRRYNHTPAFRREEEKFEHYEKAERWIEQNVRKLKRNARRK